MLREAVKEMRKGMREETKKERKVCDGYVISCRCVCGMVGQKTRRVWLMCDSDADPVWKSYRKKK